MEFILCQNKKFGKSIRSFESEISKSTFNTFLKDTELKEIRDNVAIIFVIHEFYAEWLNSNYKEVIQTIMKDVIGYEVEPKFFTAEQLVNLMRQVVNLTRQANLNVKSLNMVMKAQINSILTIHLILSSLTWQ